MNMHGGEASESGADNPMPASVCVAPVTKDPARDVERDMQPAPACKIDRSAVHKGRSCVMCDQDRAVEQKFEQQANPDQAVVAVTMSTNAAPGSAPHRPPNSVLQETVSSTAQ